MTLSKWLRPADLEDGVKPGPSRTRSPSCVRRKRRIRLLGAGERGAAPGGGLSVAGEPAGKRLYPLVSELAADGVPVAVTCRVLKLPASPTTAGSPTRSPTPSWSEAHRADAIFDAHRDDPEFGYRFLLDEARDAGQAMAERTAWRICSENGWWRRSARRSPSKAARPDRRPTTTWSDRDFTATAPNMLWLSDITEHRTEKASSTSARSRTSGPTGSSATRSTAG